MKLKIKVVPGASKESLEWLGDDNEILKIRVKAAPEKGKANKAVEKFLAKRLGLPTGKVNIVSGATSREKLVEIDGMSAQDVRNKLE